MPCLWILCHAGGPFTPLHTELTLHLRVADFLSSLDGGSWYIVGDGEVDVNEMGADEMKVDEGVEIPPRRRGRFSSVAEEMVPGGSVGVESYRAAEALREALRRTGKKAAVRKVGKGTWRVWCVQREESEKGAADE